MGDILARGMANKAILKGNAVEILANNASARAVTAETNAINFAKDFGLGTIAKDIGSLDLNTLDLSGFYKGAGGANRPPAVSGANSSGYFYYINMKHDSSWKSQIAIEFATGTMFTRALNVGTWTAWKQSATTDVVTTTINGLMIAADKAKLDGIATSANNYVHPTTHPASIIVQDASNRFATDTEKTTWNGKANTTVATTGANGLMSSTDKSKLDGVAASANNYSHPTGDGNTHVPATGTSNNGKLLKAGATTNSASWGNITFTELTDVNITNPQIDHVLNFDGTRWLNSDTPTAKAFLNGGYKTSLSTTTNQWTKIASVSLTARYQVGTAKITFMAGEDAGATGTAPVGVVFFRTRQTAAMGSAPVVGVRLMENQNITNADLVAITSVNTAASTVVDLYIKVVDTAERFTFVPTIVNGTGVTFLEEQPMLAALPAGTQAVGTYEMITTAQLPVASGSVAGIVKLSAVTNSTSATLAATASAIKIVYDLATSKASTDVATISLNGLMSASDKTKLDTIEVSANNYVHPTSHPATIITQDASNRFVSDAEKATWNAKASTVVVSTSANGLMISTDKAKLDGIAAGATNYTHPANHPASIITQDASNRFVTDTEKTTWNGKANTTAVTTSANGLMSNADKVKLDGIASGANVYTHPTNHPASVITQDSSNRFVTDSEKTIWNDKYTRNEVDNKVSTAISSLDWKAAVATFSAIATTYPNPLDGWTTSVKDTDLIYRYSGTAWVEITSSGAVPLATTTVDGKMSAADKVKLNGIAVGATAYTHPATHPPSIIALDASNRFVTDSEKATWNAKANNTVVTISTAGLMSNTDKTKLDGITAGANVYSHPATHPASIIVQDASNRFITDAERTAWNAAETNAKNHANTLTTTYINDTRTTNELPSFYGNNGRKVFSEFKQVATLGLPTTATGTYCMVVTYARWSNSSGGPITQVAYTDSGKQFTRVSDSGHTSWNAWIEQETTTGAQAKANAVNSEQVNLLASGANAETALLTSYPTGLTTMRTGQWSIGFGVVVTTRTQDNLGYQFHYQTSTSTSVSFRYYSSAGWTAWTTQETTAGAQAKANAVNALNLSLTGGKLTGETTIETALATPFILKRTSAANLNMQFTHPSATGYLGIDTTGNFKFGTGPDLTTSGSIIESTTGSQAKVNTHAGDAVKHITAAERTAWNAAETNAKNASLPRTGGTVTGDLITTGVFKSNKNSWVATFAVGETKKTITHSIGSTNYMVALGANSVARHAAWENKTSTTVDIVLDEAYAYGNIVVDIIIMGY